MSTHTPDELPGSGFAEVEESSAGVEAISLSSPKPSFESFSSSAEMDQESSSGYMGNGRSKKENNCSYPQKRPKLDTSEEIQAVYMSKKLKPSKPSHGPWGGPSSPSHIQEMSPSEHSMPHMDISHHLMQTSDAHHLMHLTSSDANKCSQVKLFAMKKKQHIQVEQLNVADIEVRNNIITNPQQHLLQQQQQQLRYSYNSPQQCPPQQYFQAGSSQAYDSPPMECLSPSPFIPLQQHLQLQQQQQLQPTCQQQLNYLSPATSTAISIAKNTETTQHYQPL